MDFATQIRLKAQEGIKRRMFAAADSTTAKLFTVGGNIAEECGCIPIYGSVKDPGKAQEKVDREYGGDWMNLKDAVRMTIVVPPHVPMQRVQHVVRATCRPSNGYSLMKDTETRPQDDPCGYSGVNFVIALPGGGRPGEIQVNTTEMMYGKMRKVRFLESVGQHYYGKIKGDYAVEGGLGHALYEIYRVEPHPKSEKADAAATLSKDYYSYLRGKPDANTAAMLRASINGYRQRYPGALPQEISP